MDPSWVNLLKSDLPGAEVLDVGPTVPTTVGPKGWSRAPRDEEGAAKGSVYESSFGYVRGRHRVVTPEVEAPGCLREGQESGTGGRRGVTDPTGPGPAGPFAGRREDPASQPPDSPLQTGSTRGCDPE